LYSINLSLNTVYTQPYVQEDKVNKLKTKHLYTSTKKYHKTKLTTS